MDAIQTLVGATSALRQRLPSLSPTALAMPTPCEGWSVRDLADHLINGSQLAVSLSKGVSLQEALGSVVSQPLDSDVIGGTLEHWIDAQQEALSAPEVMFESVHHPIGDITGEQLIYFRAGDLAVHTWDLSRALSLDEEFDDGLIEALWEQFAPLGDLLPSTGQFGDGRSGSVAHDEPVLIKLLDLMGRRP